MFSWKNEISQTKRGMLLSFPSMALLFLILPVGLYAIAMIFLGTEDYALAPQWSEALQSANQILSVRGMCTTQQACAESSVSIYPFGYERMFRKGIKVEIFGTSDSALIDEIDRAFVNEFEKTPSINTLDIRAFSITHQEYLTFPYAEKNKIKSVRELHVER